jgi:6-phosphogluconolactonase
MSPATLNNAFRLILIAFSVFLMNSSMPAKYRFIIGTYTKNSKESVHYASFDPVGKKIELISHSEFVDNPSFVTLNKTNSVIYATSEADKGSIVSLDLDKKTGKIIQKNIKPTGGAHPCHVVLDKTEKWLIASNYTGGSLTVFPILKDGKLGERSQFIQYTGNGPDKARQEKAHIHSAFFSKDFKNVLVQDLGTDKIFNYTFNVKTGKLKQSQEVLLSAGSGPRHVVFHETLPYVYVIQELMGKISTYKWAKGKLIFVQEISSLPPNFKGENFSADIHISFDGRFLYASNRYFDTIVSCEIDQNTGKLTQLEQTAVKGKLPRNFAITPDGKYMLVANQGSNNVVAFRLEKGKMVDLEVEKEVSMPVCIKFLN